MPLPPRAGKMTGHHSGHGGRAAATGLALIVHVFLSPHPNKSTQMNRLSSAINAACRSLLARCERGPVRGRRAGRALPPASLEISAAVDHTVPGKEIYVSRSKNLLHSTDGPVLVFSGEGDLLRASATKQSRTRTAREAPMASTSNSPCAVLLAYGSTTCLWATCSSTLPAVVISSCAAAPPARI